MIRLSRRAAVLSGLAAGTTALVTGPEAPARAAASRATPAAPAAALAAHLDVAQPSFLAFLREAGIDTTLMTRAGGGSGFIAPEPTFAPLPATAHGPTIPASGYLTQEIRGGVYWVTDGSCQCMFLVTGQGVIAVDAPPSSRYQAHHPEGGYSNFWALYRTYLDTVVDTATAATLAKWNGRLGAVDVFTRDNAYTMQTSLRID